MFYMDDGSDEFDISDISDISGVFDVPGGLDVPAPIVIGADYYAMLRFIANTSPVEARCLMEGASLLMREIMGVRPDLFSISSVEGRVYHFTSYFAIPGKSQGVIINKSPVSIYIGNKIPDEKFENGIFENGILKDPRSINNIAREFNFTEVSLAEPSYVVSALKLFKSVTKLKRRGSCSV